MTKSLPDAAQPANSQTTPVIRIVQGSLLEQTGLDAIISFLPENLAWKGPVNRVILERVGPALDAYILDHIHAPRRGTAFTVPAGLWDGPRLIFAVVEPWDGGMGDGDRTLRKSLRCVLDIAVREGVTVLGIPALGQGNSDFPMRRAARLMAAEIRERPLPQLREVRLVCKTPELFQSYRDFADELSTG